MKKILLLGAVAAGFFAITLVQAEEANQFTPVWEAIQDLREAVGMIEARSSSGESAGGPSPKGLIGFNYKKDFPHERTLATAFASVPGRMVSYEKHKDESILRVTYDDSFGVTFREKGECRWRLLVDGRPVDRDKIFSFMTGSGGAVVTNRVSDSVSWILTDVPKGFYQFKIQARRVVPQNATLGCDNGFQDDVQENSLIVEELVK